MIRNYVRKFEIIKLALVVQKQTRTQKIREFEIILYFLQQFLINFENLNFRI